MLAQLQCQPLREVGLWATGLSFGDCICSDNFSFVIVSRDILVARLHIILITFALTTVEFHPKSIFFFIITTITLALTILVFSNIVPWAIKDHPSKAIKLSIVLILLYFILYLKELIITNISNDLAVFNYSITRVE